MTRIFALLLLCFVVGCGTKDHPYDYQHYGFDKQVIGKLPLYDSLVSLLIKNYPLIYQHTKGPFYRFIPSEDGTRLYKELPQEDAVKVKDYFTQIGDSLITGFDFYRDSTIKIFVRDIYVQSDHLNIEERLSFYPNEAGIKRKEYPIKDTIINTHWQYWISFDKEAFF
jgi:hypothetical protein